MNQHQEKNWKELIDIIKQYFTEDPRINNIIQLYTHFKNRILESPASSIEYYHSSYPGGYIQHILNVTNISQKIFNLFTELQLRVNNYTEPEMIFAAIHHDLGKIGDLKNPMYIPNESEWHIKNQGKLYNINENLQHMSIPDRSIYLLNQFNIKLSMNEFLGIKLHDGLYNDSNKEYFITYNKPGQILKTNLPYLIHFADMIAVRMEYEQWKYGNDTILDLSSNIKNNDVIPPITAIKNEKYNIPTADKPIAEFSTIEAKGIFNELFNKMKNGEK